MKRYLIICTALLVLSLAAISDAQWQTGGQPYMTPQWAYPPQIAAPRISRPSTTSIQTDVSAKLLWTRASLNWKDQVSLSGKGQVGEFSVSLMQPQYRIKYSITSSLGLADNVTPQGALTIGSTSFGGNPTQSGQSGEQKPIQLDWTLPTSHRLIVEGPLYQSLRPVLAAEWTNLTMKGTKDDGKTDFETLQATSLGVGACADYTSGWVTTRALCVGSNGYLYAEVGGSLQLFQQCFLTAGWEWRAVPFPDNTHIRTNTGKLGLKIVF